MRDHLRKLQALIYNHEIKQKMHFKFAYSSLALLEISELLQTKISDGIHKYMEDRVRIILGIHKYMEDRV